MDQAKMRTLFRRLTLASGVLAFIVVVLGAYVRLTDAGLGCPDWPGCYGQLIAPDPDHLEVQQNYPNVEIETAKAWKEMIHRYFAGMLGLLILSLAIIAWLNRFDTEQSLILPFGLLILVIFQAALGMWTVTMLLRPVIVTLHLLMGMATLALIWWQYFRINSQLALLSFGKHNMSIKGWAVGALLIVYLQIALGGWVSTNYAALHCPDFPTCQQQWWPNTDFSGAFHLMGEDGINYEGGKLTNDQGVTVHLMHRIGALLVFAYLSTLIFLAFRHAGRSCHDAVIVIGVLLVIQIALGISNVVFMLPLAVAVAHNAVAALLLIAIVYLNHIVNQNRVAIRH